MVLIIQATDYDKQVGSQIFVVNQWRTNAFSGICRRCALITFRGWLWTCTTIVVYRYKWDSQQNNNNYIKRHSRDDNQVYLH